MNPRPLPDRSSSSNANYAHVLSICRRLLQPPIDYENVAQQIIYECLRAGIDKPSRRIIRARCISAIQAHKLRQQHERDARKSDCLGPAADLAIPSDPILLADLLRRAQLTSAERAALHARYWHGQSATTTTTTNNEQLNGHREALRSALRKLRKVELE